jgi:hypothetical protein
LLAGLLACGSQFFACGCIHFFTYANTTLRRFAFSLDFGRLVVDKMKGSKMSKLNRTNQAVRNAEASVLAELLRQRAKSNASGTHANKADKRARTRNAKLNKALREWN